MPVTAPKINSGAVWRPSFSDAHVVAAATTAHGAISAQPKNFIMHAIVPIALHAWPLA